MMALLRLLRWPNLVIVFLTQYLFYQRLYVPALTNSALHPELSFADFMVLSLTTIALTAGGYILNDILNLDADYINHPDRPLPTGKINLRNARWLYIILSIAGFISALFLGFSHGYLHLLFLYPLSISLLVAYSVSLQRKILWGNLLISAFCAGVPLLIWLAEFPSLQLLRGQASHGYQVLAGWTFWYAGLAFLSNLFREIVKDMQDVNGDQRCGMRTLPVAKGLAASRLVAWLVDVLLLVLIVVPYVSSSSKSPLFTTLLFVLGFLPFLLAGLFLIQYQKPHRLRLVSHLIKVGMAGGLLALYFV